MEITGEMIKASRERQRMTQQELADEVGVSLRTVGSWERGETVPRNRMGAVAEALDIPTGEERDYGQLAVRRRLGILAKQRREQLGLSRVAFAQHAGMHDQAVQQFEFAQRWPRTATLRKLETALGWKFGVTEDILTTRRAASSIKLEDLDDPAIERVGGGQAVLAHVPTQELLEELIFRLGELQRRGVMVPTREDLYGNRLRSKSAPAASDFDLAASDDHVEGEDDND